MLKIDSAIVPVFANNDGHRIIKNHYQVQETPFNGLKTLRLINFNIKSIDVDCFSKLEHLEKLDLSCNNLVNLESKTFEHLKSLKYLGLDMCGLRDLPEDIFSDLDQLEILILDRNSLTRLRSNIFDNLKSLRFLYLFRLPSNIIIEDNVFDSLEKLEELAFDFDDRHQSINSLKQNVFSRLKSLTKLDMSCCNLRSIKKEWFSSLNKLEELNLSYNHIDILDLTTFINLKLLKKITLDDDQVTYNQWKQVSHDEFEQIMKDQVNKYIKVEFIEHDVQEE